MVLMISNLLIDHLNDLISSYGMLLYPVVLIMLMISSMTESYFVLC